MLVAGNDLLSDGSASRLFSFVFSEPRGTVYVLPGFSSAFVAAATAVFAASRFFSAAGFCGVAAWDTSSSALARSSSAFSRPIRFSALAAAVAIATASAAC